jgi:large subunit ribosomal protein L15
MQLHQLKPIHRKKSRKRVGRGGKKGTYSGRGMKGQKARAGKKPRLDFVGGDTPLTKRLPKQRGEVGKVKLRRGVKIARLRSKPVVFNLKDIEKKFKEGEVISPQSLLKKGLIGKIKGKIPRVKILGEGEIKKKLEFKEVELSKKAEAKVKKAEKTVKSSTKSKAKSKTKG